MTSCPNETTRDKQHGTVREAAPDTEQVNDRPSLLEHTRAEHYADQALHAIVQIEQAANEAEAIVLLQRATRCLGADAAVFTTVIQEDARQATHYSLVACDPVWSSLYAAHGWSEDDPWLHYAMQCGVPKRASELQPATPRQQEIVQAAARAGFQSALIVPAPRVSPPPHLAHLGVLYIGSQQPGYFDSGQLFAFQSMAQILAMTVHEWQLHRVRSEWCRRVRLTEQELLLLRYEAAGLSSKAIAAALHSDARTIDCRFQRLNYKLNSAHRRDAARKAKLYGLI